MGGELRGRREGKNEGKVGREPSLISLQSLPFFSSSIFDRALLSEAWNKLLITLPHFLEITRDLFFVAGAQSAWSRGSGNKSSQAERLVSVFIFWLFFASLYQPVPFVFVFSGNKIKVGGDR